MPRRNPTELKSENIRIRVEKTLRERFDRMIASARRSESDLAREALRRYVEQWEAAQDQEDVKKYQDGIKKKKSA